MKDATRTAIGYLITVIVAITLAGVILPEVGGEVANSIQKLSAALEVNTHN